MKFFRQLAEALSTGAVVLATVIQVRGSVPREVGAKMIVCADGRIFDTIGGGAGEAKVIRQAKNMLQSDPKRLVEIDLTKQLVEIDLSGAPQHETDGICGGRMQIWLERWQGECSIALVEQILNRLESGHACTLVIPLTTYESPHLLPDDMPVPTDAFVECLQPSPTLLIIGAGHIGIELAKAATPIGFQVFVQDDRPEWANVPPYPDAIKILAEPIAAAIARFPDHPQLYVALVSRAYQYDVEALKALLKRARPCQYIGMVGSEKRVRQVYQAIRDSKISKANPASIYAPIGLDIGALTPAEIAISIAAELILVRRGGTGKSLSVYCNDSSTPTPER